MGDPNTQANTQASLHAMFAMFCSSKSIFLLSSFLICLICFGLKGEQSKAVDGRAQSRPQVLKDLDVGEGSCPLIQAPRRQAVREDRHGKTASELSKDHECHLAEDPQNTSKFESKCINMHQNMWNQQLSLCSNLGIEMSISNTSMFVKYDQICLFLKSKQQMSRRWVGDQRD